jgi:HK97 family phage major capsid protein
MNILELLKEKLALIEQKIEGKKMLLEKTEDSGEIKKITDGLMSDFQDSGSVKTQIEAEEKRIEVEVETAQQNSVIAGKLPGTPVAVASFPDSANREMGPPAEYKSGDMTFKLHREIESLQEEGIGMVRLSSKMVQRYKENPKKAEAVAKFMCDLIARAYSISAKGPGTVAQMKTALAEGTTYSGAEIVTPEVRRELLYYTRDESIALMDATVVPMSSNTYDIEAENAKVNTYFGAEADAVTESDPTFVETTITARRLAAYSKTSNELIQDTFITGGISGILLPQFIEAVGQRIDSVVFIGIGSDSAVFSGLFIGAGARVGYSQVFGTGSTNFSELLYTDITGLVAQVPARYVARNGKWYMHQQVLHARVANIKDTTGNPIFIGNLGGGGGFPGTIYGFNYRLPSVAPYTSAVNTAFILFGDLRGVFIGERLSDFSLLVDPYTAMGNNQTKFYIFTRWGFGIPLPNLLGVIATHS